MLRGYARCILRLVLAASSAFGLHSIAYAEPSSDVPGMQPVLLAPISPEGADQLIADREDSGEQNSGLSELNAAKGDKTDAALKSLAVPSAPIPASIAELARALKYDPVLIYEFVHNNIEYLPIWGMLKGPEGALTDGVGTAFDIAQLTAQLINTNPASGTSATLVRGTVTMSGGDAASWIALNGMNICPLASTFATGGIPISTTATGPACNGVATATIGHVWVKVIIGGVTYEIDPSFKAHTVVTPTVNLATATGYDRASFLAAACTSCNTNPNVVTTLNRANILNPANTHSLPKYAKSLLSYLQTNNIRDLDQVLGGHKIVPTYHTSLPPLPYTVASRVADPFTIDGSWKASLLVNFNGISQLFSSDAIYGKRLTVTFNGSNYPQLNLDGSVVQTGTTAVAPGSSATMNLSLCMPFSGVNCSVATVDGSGKALWCSNPSPVRCETASILSGGVYAITNSWGPVSGNMVERHRRASIQATNAGIPAASEANLGEVLTAQGFSYTQQSGLYLGMSEDGMRDSGYHYYVVGVSGHTGVGGGPYVDLPLVTTFAGVNTALNGDGTYTPTFRTDNFLDMLGQGSVLESTVVNQVSGVSSVSTAKLLDIGISQTTNNNVYDLKSCANYTSYNGSLVGYTAALKAVVQDLVCNKSYRVVLPQRGNLTDPAITTTPTWTGGAFYGFPLSGNGGYPAMISGGYAGGYSGAPNSVANFDGYADNAFGNEIVVTARSPNVTANFNGGDRYVYRPVIQPIGRLVSDPVDQITGAFVKNVADISIGEEKTPRLISLERSYTSADTSPGSPMGQGWKHNLDIWAQTTSDGVRPTGVYDAWDAAEMLAAKFVIRDLMSDPTLPVVNIAVGAIANRWLGDRLVNNIVTVSTGNSAFNFQRMADDDYNPSQHSAARLSGPSSARIVKASDGAQFAFGTPDANGLARVSAITQPSGIVTSFGYTSGQLSQVSNNLGRRLNLNWTSGKITSVTDTSLAGAAVRTVTYTYSGNLLQQVTDVRGGRTLYCYDAAGLMTSYYLPTEGSGTNCAAATPHIANVYDTLGRVKQQTDGGGHVTDLYLAGTRAEMVTHPGSGVADVRMIRYADNFGNIVRDVSPRTNLATSYRFNALSQLVRTDLPEGNAVEISYDIRGNPTRTCTIPKPAGAYPACDTSGGSQHIWTTTAYNEGAVWHCVTLNTCNKPQSVTDPLGNVTTLTYYADGQTDTITAPTPTGYAGAPKTKFTYTATASLSGNINLLTQSQVTATAGSPPSIINSFGYDTAANGLVLKTDTLDPSGLNYITTFGYDGYGNRTTVDGPRTDVTDLTTTVYNADRDPVTITYPNPGSGSPVTQMAYNGDGRMTSTARKLGGSWMVSCNSYTPSGQIATSFGPWKTASATDCSFGGNTAVPSTAYTYDGADRLITITAAEPTGARVTQTSLFPDGLTQSMTRAFGTAVAATETTAYSSNGLPLTVTDARGNISGMVYDGFDRLSLMKYPLAAGGGPSASDVTAFAYDKRDAIIKRSIRGTSDVSGSCTQCISFAYDQLNRLKEKTVPSMAANSSVIPAVAAVSGYSVYYGYDLIGRLTSQGYSSVTPELTFAYDNANRLTSAVQYGRTVGYSYGTPAQGLARTMTWPSAAGSMLTCTDALGRVSQIKEAADCTTTTGRLAAYAYDDLSRRTSITRPNSTGTAYSYEDTGTLDTLSHTLTGAGSVSYGFDYNRVLQITGRSTDNDLYAWMNNYNVNRLYTTNGLDQYGAIMGNNAVWDARGNLLSYRGSSYGFDGENRLAAVISPSATVATSYDPAGRLRQTSAATGTQLLYDGTALIAEYNASGGALTGRYVPGPGVDETTVAYDSVGTKSWYHADAQGSVVAASDASGAAVVINQYGPFGETGLISAGRNQGRLRYTGQAIIPELDLYNYKARIYAPSLGRFIQTDPLGAMDDLNLYGYVQNDPINRSDPNGLYAENVNASPQNDQPQPCNIAWTPDGDTKGDNPTPASGRWNTDLPGGWSDAWKVFSGLSRLSGETDWTMFPTPSFDNATTLAVSKPGGSIRLRVGIDYKGGMRVGTSPRIDIKAGALNLQKAETIHFTGGKGNMCPTP